jgi:hypothetical protein
MITYQFLFSAKSWKGPQGDSLILPKGERERIMASAFICRELSLGPELTDEQLLTIDHSQIGKEFVTKEDATSLFGTV